MNNYQFEFENDCTTICFILNYYNVYDIFGHCTLTRSPKVPLIINGHRRRPKIYPNRRVGKCVLRDELNKNACRQTSVHGCESKTLQFLTYALFPVTPTYKYNYRASNNVNLALLVEKSMYDVISDSCLVSKFKLSTVSWTKANKQYTTLWRFSSNNLQNNWKWTDKGSLVQTNVRPQHFLVSVFSRDLSLLP